MWWIVLALLSGSYVDIVNDSESVRICAAAADLSADQAAANGADALDVKVGRSVATLYLARLKELGGEDAAAFAAAKQALTDSDDDMALYDKCQTIAMSIPADGTLVDGALAADATTEAMDAAAAAAEPDADDGPAIDYGAMLAGLGDARRGEVRCATLASLVMYEVARHPDAKTYGLTAQTAEALAARLAAAIMAETGWDKETMRGVFKQDYEDFTFSMLGDDQDEATAQAIFDRAMADCQPTYAER